MAARKQERRISPNSSDNYAIAALGELRPISPAMKASLPAVVSSPCRRRGLRRVRARMRARA